MKYKQRQINKAHRIKRQKAKEKLVREKAAAKTK